MGTLTDREARPRPDGHVYHPVVRLDQLDLAQAGTLALPDLLNLRVQETPEAPAIRAVAGDFTFSQWHARAAAVADLLDGDLGSLRGERVMLWMSNDDVHDFLVALHALFMLGAVAVAVDDRSTPREAQALIGLVEPKGALLSSRVIGNLGGAGLAKLGLRELPAGQPDIIHLVAVRDGQLTGNPVAVRFESLPATERHSVVTSDEDAIIFFSSGSTGTPKGAAWTHGSLVEYAERAAHAVYALPRGGKWLGLEDVLQSPIPIYTAAAIMENPYVGVLAGCPVVYETRRFDAVASQGRMLKMATTVYNGAPPHFAMLCDLPLDSAPPMLELMVSGGSAFTEPLYRAMRERWPQVAIANWYGLMESGCGQTLNFGPDMERHPGAIGRPVAPTELRVVGDDFVDVAQGQEGELWMRAPGQMREYLRNPEQTAQRLYGGWLRTGDRAGVDRDGLVSVVGRHEERINRGGFKFYPVEVECVLEEHRSVREASVVGVPHAILGEVPVAFVVPTADATIDVNELRRHCRDQIAPNKVPSEILVRTELPRTAYGKVVRRELVREYQQLQNTVR